MMCIWYGLALSIVLTSEGPSAAAQEARTSVEDDAAARSMDESEAIRRFYSEPEAAELRQLRDQAQAARDRAARIVRNPSDPILRRHEEEVEAIDRQLALLWRQFRDEPRAEEEAEPRAGQGAAARALVEQLEAQVESQRAALRQAEENLEQARTLRDVLEGEDEDAPADPPEEDRGSSAGARCVDHAPSRVGD